MQTRPAKISFRIATRNDVPVIVKMLSNDPLGKKRENLTEPLPHSYYAAFDNINADPNQELVVVIDGDMEIIGTLQLTFIQYLTYQGGVRAQVEAVRIREDARGEGLGKKMLEWAIQRAKERHAHVVQLTTDKQRPEAIRFYEQLGFKASHEGMKLHL
jgi:GNAT superfamily N-acetyltransferase